MPEPQPVATPSPSAALPDINESGGDDLGIRFSETVTIRCE